MNHKAIKEIFVNLLNQAGVTINGVNPWDLQIHNENLYARVLKHGSLGFGEAYMEGWWDCECLDQFFYRVMGAELDEKIKADKWLWPKLIFYKLFNPQSKQRALIVGRKHYDLGNDLFEAMLDSRMNYTCGYWQNAENLEQAQINKMEFSCRKLQLQPGMRMLDIGCGFGALARYAAEHYGVEVVGITISQQQFAYAQKNCAKLPIEIRLLDYRDIHGQFDRVASLGMFEHVGMKNYALFFQKVQACLKKEGLFLLHTIGGNKSRINTDAWINQYIFPNGMIPSVAQISKASEGRMIMENWDNFGVYYDSTLMAWAHNFEKNWPALRGKYDDVFYRMWRYYLYCCAGIFRARQLQLWQIVYSPKGVAAGYRPPPFDGRISDC
ncbi:MAG: cyclopropane-fatty-acyl-phospholipid synthase [Legionella sp. 40-6]|nr:MAG: cyclopropane-fatty-acyl-phospholipid synthase [Legionella sp. 40-6]